jgi:hypothetical protein
MARITKPLGVNPTRHTERTSHSFIPFWRTNRPTALFTMDYDRYKKYFSKQDISCTSREYINWHQVKQNIQTFYQDECTEQGRVLKDIWIQRQAHAKSNAKDYLLWLDYQYTMYQKVLEEDIIKFDNFAQFVQSELSYNENLGD